MQRELLKESSLTRAQGDAEKSLNVDLSAKSRLLPYGTAADTLGLNDLYIEERDACENYRMIFTVNPVCSNILFNAVTEPVYKEGSYSAVCLALSSVSRTDEDIFPEGTMNHSGDVVDRVLAVRDTEFSHPRIGDFKYHCGYDIFNNHLLRTSEFGHVKMEESVNPINLSGFNTIYDFSIDFSGKTVERPADEADGPASAKLVLEKMRLYQLDNIKSFNAAFYDGLREVDGWFGFYNSGYINLSNGKLNKSDIFVNRILNNETPCGFVDLYPDRTLYSFIPKVNRYKKRLERNWDCAIVYPFESDYETFGKLNENDVDAVKILSQRVIYDNTGNEVIEMRPLFRHTLSAGSEIRLFYKNSPDDPEIKRYPVPVRVKDIGDPEGKDTNRCFTVRLYDIETVCEVVEDEEGKKRIMPRDDTGATEDMVFFYKRIEDGYDDRYYFRRFKELLNYEYVELLEGEEVPEDAQVRDVTYQPAIITESSPAYIRYDGTVFKKISRPLTYTQNKIAFAGNIYGDRVAQVIFNDDICVTGLKDNLGRPLSTVYLMSLKTNRGHKEWYLSGDTSADTVEYSHCFGPVSSGLDLPADSGVVDYNVRKLHNISRLGWPSSYEEGLLEAIIDLPKGGGTGDVPLPLENDLTLEDYDEFYGDVVEFSKPLFRETTIEKVYYRFNTAQRESMRRVFFDIHYDELTGDLFDVDNAIDV